METKYGGYEGDLVEEPHDRFICTICTKILRDPHLVVCCGKKYCISCLENWFKEKCLKSCPHCRAKGCAFQFVIEKGMKSEIESFKVRCSNSKEGCEWVGELGVFESHLNGCGYHEVSCTNGCKVGKMKRRNLDQHLAKECVLRKYVCLYCSSVGTVQERIKHLNMCSKVPISCPNKCGRRGMVREDVTQHLQSCRLQAVICEYAEVGCKAPPMIRQEILLHAQKEQGMHLKLVTGTYRSLKRTLEQTAEVIKLEATKLDVYDDRDISAVSSCLKTCISPVCEVSKGKLWFRMSTTCTQEGKTWRSPDFKCNDCTFCLEVTLLPSLQLTLRTLSGIKQPLKISNYLEISLEDMKSSNSEWSYHFLSDHYHFRWDGCSNGAVKWEAPPPLPANECQEEYSLLWTVQIARPYRGWGSRYW